MNLIILYFIIGSFFLFIISKILIKFNILVEKVSRSSHKKFLYLNNKKTYSGGIFLLITLALFLSETNFFFIVSIILIFLVGVLSDIDFLSSPKIRLFIQFVVIIFFTIYTNILVEETRIELIDSFLQNNLFKIVFTIFCFLVLINGCNFIDGVNSLLIGYFLIVSICIFTLINSQSIMFEEKSLEIIICCLLILFIFNFFSKIIMGDSGAYLLGFLFGYYAIILSNENLNISPIYILNLLWYPAFENLFSILRKIKSKISVSTPDNLHLHHFIYLELKKKFKKNNFNNSLTGILINLLNAILLAVATIFANHSGYLSIILGFNIFIYLFSYYFLKTKNLKN
tara:strand:- start:363 stop:1388 length:1026 start_codon:yes stop_codon:yes gene_type:complete